MNRKVLEFPSDRDGRMNAILNIVNGEFKSIALLHLTQEHACTGGEIYSRMRKTLGNSCYIPHYTVFSQYCSNTLYPIGTVAKEEMLTPNSFAYALTSAGEKYGLPLAAFSLDWAMQNETSLFPILGPTLSGGETRAPVARAKILEALVQKNGQSISELGSALSLWIGDIRGHALSLEKQRFVEFQTIGRFSEQRDARAYEFVDNAPEPQTVRKSIHQTRQVYEVMKRMKTGSYRDVMHELGQGNIGNISSIMSGLGRQGILKRVSWKVGDAQSSVRITAQGISFVKNFITPVRRALDEETALEELSRAYLLPLREDDARFTTLCQKTSTLYAAASPYINRRGTNSRSESMMAHIAKAGRRVSISEFASQEKLSLTRTGLILNRLEKAGRIISTFDDDNLKWYELKR